jgi:signal peptidase I
MVNRETVIATATVVFVAVTVYFIYLLGPQVFVDVLMGHADHYRLGIGNGTSMLPFIYPGDAVIIDIKPTDIEIGDIIVYIYDDPYDRYDGILIGHRVVAIVQEGYITEGDNNPRPDRIVYKEQVVGKIVWIVHDPSPLDLWILERLFT